jgi:hypothetical protein
MAQRKANTPSRETGTSKRMSEVISLYEKVVQAELAVRVLNLPPEREEMSTEADDIAVPRRVISA